MTKNHLDASTNVLVVDDEMLLRMRAVDIVEDAGFVAVNWNSSLRPSLTAVCSSEVFSDRQVYFTGKM